MKPASENPSHRSGRNRILLLLLIGISLAVSLVVTWRFSPNARQQSLFTLANLVGEATRNMLAGKGLLVCMPGLGTYGNPPCFHASRMPVASLVVGFGIRLLGDHPMRVNFLKTLLLLAPLELAIYLVWLRMPRFGMRRWGMALLLLLPFAMTPFLADVVNMQVEEGYSYSLLAVAVAVLFFALRPGSRGRLGYAVVFGVAIDGMYLAKSSMWPAVVVLVAGYLLLEHRKAAQALVMILALAAPLGWALHQHDVSGRYSIGTSLDGFNFHKGNNPTFLWHYPPPPSESPDQYDAANLERGVYFKNEWSFNDFHMHAGEVYMRTHPKATLVGDMRKFDVLLLSIHKYGSSDNFGIMLKIETIGLLVFRILFWTAFAGAVYWLLRPAGGRSNARFQRIAGGLFLALAGSCAVPYLAGYAYTRHASILIYPAALMWCLMLAEETPSGDDRDRVSAAS